jgi:trehalose 6-phosphate synthase
MPLTERRMRWEAMMAKLRRGTIQQWFESFVQELQETQLDRSANAPLMPDRVDMWPRRSAQGGVRIH